VVHGGRHETKLWLVQFGSLVSFCALIRSININRHLKFSRSFCVVVSDFYDRKMADFPVVPTGWTKTLASS